MVFEVQDLDEASQYSKVMELVRNRVKPERDKYTGSTSRDRYLRKNWWLFRGYRKDIELYAKENPLLIARSVVSKYSIFVQIDSNYVCTAALTVFLLNSHSDFAFLQSSIHEAWSLRYSSSLGIGDTPRYIAGRCFNTFAKPKATIKTEEAGNQYHETRKNISIHRKIGLTDLYNNFHDPTCTDPDIQTLRHLHIQMDNAVAAAYGWHDLPLNHDFHDTKQGLRFTISEEARREVLDRLLALNHQRYAEEVAQGLHDKKKKGKVKTVNKKQKKQPPDSAPKQGMLF